MKKEVLTTASLTTGTAACFPSCSSASFHAEVVALAYSCSLLAHCPPGYVSMANILSFKRF